MRRRDPHPADFNPNLARWRLASRKAAIDLRYTGRPKPIDPLWRDLVASLENYLRETTMLVDAVEMALGEGAINGSIARVLRQRAQAVRQARSGED
jgi:hypothetical protein